MQPHITYQPRATGQRRATGQPPATGQRRGSMAIELMVAASLLVCMMGILAPLTVRTGRAWKDGHHMRMALNELSNQIDVLTSLSASELATALEQLTPSEEILQVLPEVSLQGETVRDADGSRIVLSIEWQRPAGAMPISMVGWIDARAVEPAEADADSAASSARGDVSGPIGRSELTERTVSKEAWL